MTLTLVVAAVVLAGVGAAVVWLRWRLRVVTVDGVSMLPTLADGDRVLMRRARLRQVRIGDIVVLDHPQRDLYHSAAPGEHLIIKRAVALPGDPVPASVVVAAAAPAGGTVPAGAMVVIGDNATGSTDSRHFGYASASDLLGVVIRPMSSPARASEPRP